jgi:hypothetical protein
MKTEEEAKAELALGMNRQRRELIAQARGSGFGVAHVAALVWPVLLMAFGAIGRDLATAERLIACAAAMGLIFLYTASQADAARRTRALLRLMEREP